MSDASVHSVKPPQLPPASWLGLRALFNHRRLLWEFTLRSVHLQTRGSALGFVWIVLNPLLMMVLYTFVFGIIFKGRYHAHPGETAWDYALGIYLSLTVYGLVADVLNSAPAAVLSQPNFVKKVVFPLEILPASLVGAALVRFAITLGLVVIGIAALGPGLRASLLWLPLIVLPTALIAYGISLIVSSLGVFLRDIGQVTGPLSLVLLWASAVFYSSSSIPEHLQPYLQPFLQANPLLHAVELSRAAALWGTSPFASPLAFALLWAFGLLLTGGGLWCFHRLRPAFADVI